MTMLSCEGETQTGINYEQIMIRRVLNGSYYSPLSYRGHEDSQIITDERKSGLGGYLDIMFREVRDSPPGARQCFCDICTHLGMEATSQKESVIVRE
jgi:hypothetical protein